MVSTPEYGNWVSKKFIYTPGLVGLTFSAFALVLPALLIIAGLAFIVAAYFAYVRYLFARDGRNMQDQVVELVLANLDWDAEGQALDVGCGSAALTIKLAKKYPRARVMGIDYWGKKWEYSKDMCERNAQIEGVGQRVAFQKASASALPFVDEHFDAVVSNLVFHEVSDAADKRDVIREALRVLKKGGKFTFQDLFLMKRVYGDIDDLTATVRSWGIRKVEFVRTRNLVFIPLALRLPFMLGTMSIITGEK
jgi:SAM-dependent methyltransferase